MRQLPFWKKYEIVLPSFHIFSEVNGLIRWVFASNPPAIPIKLLLQDYNPIPKIAIAKRTTLIKPLLFLPKRDSDKPFLLYFKHPHRDIKPWHFFSTPLDIQANSINSTIFPFDMINNEHVIKIIKNIIYINNNFFRLILKWSFSNQATSIIFIYWDKYLHLFYIA